MNGPGTQSLSRESLWVLVARFATILAAAASFKLAAVFLPAAEMARWSLFAGAAGFASGLLGGALNQGLGRFAHEALRRGALNGVVRRVSVAQIGLCAVGVLPVAFWLRTSGQTVFENHALTMSVLWVASTCGVLYLQLSGLTNVLRLRRSWAAAVALEGAARVLMLPLAFVFLGATFWAPAAASIGACVVGMIAAALALRKTAAPDIAAFEQWRSLRAFSLPLVGVGCAWWILQSSGRFILSHFAGLETVALYAVATGVVGATVGAAEGVISSVTLPVLYSRLSSDLTGHNAAAGEETARVGLQVLLLATAGLPFLALPLLVVFASPRYFGCAPLVAILFLAEWLRAGAGQVNGVFYARLRTGALLSPVTWAVLTQIVVAPLFVARGGLWGAVAASLVVYLVLFVATLSFAPRVFRRGLDWRPWLARVSAVAVAGLVLGTACARMPQLDMATAALAIALYGLAAAIASFSMRPHWEAALAHVPAAV
jgi:O-antigen/teichoic acid export membrane protein